MSGLLNHLLYPLKDHSMTPTRPPLEFELLPGNSMQLYLGRNDSLCVVQGRVDIAHYHWLAERVVPLTQRLQADTHYQPITPGWVQVRAVPGAVVQLQKLHVHAAPSVVSAYSRVLQFLGLASFTLKATP
jgi:hypothetical protein